jgi:hypothetical protein
MLYEPADMTQIMGLGNYVGELRRGPDGNLYEWTEGVDGLGNPIGFWKKAFSVVKNIAKAGLARLIPGPIKRLARHVCTNVDQMGPVATVVPAATPYYVGAKGLCKVLRGAGVAGYGLMEAPDVAAAIPPAAKTAARTVCGVINRLGPVLKYIPVAGSYYRKASGLCTQLKNAGIAGVDGSIMEAPDGQLYEVVEQVGAGGQRRRHLRPIRLVIPAYIGPRRRTSHGARAAQRVRTRRGPRPQPVPTSTSVHGW